MSYTHTISETRRIGDASFQWSTGADAWFQSAEDGGGLEWIGTDNFVIIGECAGSFLDTDGVQQSDTDVWLWGFGADGSNHITLRYNGPLQFLWYISGVKKADVSATLTGKLARPAGVLRYAVIKEGTAVTVAALVGDRANGWEIVKGTGTLDANRDPDEVMGANGALVLGGRCLGQPKNGMAFSNFLIASTSSAFSSVGLGTDAEIKQALLNPHAWASQHNASLTIGSYDLCDSAGSRKKLRTRELMASTDKLVCINSVLPECTLDIGGSPTDTAEAKPPYHPCTYHVQAYAAIGNPQGIHVSATAAMATLAFIDNSENVDGHVGLLDADGFLIAPTIPILTQMAYWDAGTTRTDYYGWPTGEVSFGDTHTQFTIEKTSDEICVFSNHHSNTMADTPEAGDTLYTPGFCVTIQDDSTTHSVLDSIGSAVGDVNFDTITYNVAAAVGDDICVAIRGADTTNGNVIVNRREANGTHTAREVMRTAFGDFVDAPIPLAMLNLDDTHCVAIQNHRVGGGGDWTGTTAYLFRPADFASTTQGWWAANGTMFADAMPAQQDDVSFWPLPGSGKDAVDAASDTVTASDLEYGEHIAAVEKLTIDGTVYLVCLAIRRRDVGRTQSQVYDSQLLVRVLRFDTTPTPRLVHVHDFDVTPEAVRLSGEFREGADLFLSDWQLGPKLLVPTGGSGVAVLFPNSGGLDLSDSVSSVTNLIRYSGNYRAASIADITNANAQPAYSTSDALTLPSGHASVTAAQFRGDTPDSFHTYISADSGDDLNPTYGVGCFRNSFVSPSVTATAESITDALRADADYGTAGLLADSAAAKTAAESAKELAEADKRLELDGGKYKLKTYQRGTATELIDAKDALQPDGTDVTEATDPLGGYREPSGA